MRKLMLILLVAVMTAPAMAAVTITVAQNGDCAFDIGYVCDGEDADVTETYALMAGLAIVVSVDAGTITEVVAAKDGESTAADPGYGVFMKVAQIDVTTDPENPVWVTGESPVATPGDPGTVGGIDDNQITLELGALYDDASEDMANAPLASGTLCTVTLTDTALVTITLEDVARGGIVMEGGGEPSSVVLATDVPITCGGIPPECMADTNKDYATWESLSKPDCWCYEKQANGDADGKAQYGMYPVFSDDLAILAAAYAASGLVTQPGVCADYDHEAQYGLYRVFSDDLAILAANYASAAVLPGSGPDCVNDDGDCDVTILPNSEFNFWVVAL